MHTSRRDIFDIEYSIDGYTDCDYGVYCVFEIVHSKNTTYCRDTEFDTTERDHMKEGFVPERFFEDANSRLNELPWCRLDEHWGVKNQICDTVDKDALQKANEIISAYLSSE